MLLGRWLFLVGLLALAAFAVYWVYAEAYFASPEFIILKRKLGRYAQECNDLNEHIESLKHMQSGAVATDYGEARLIDHSTYNYSRTNWAQSSSSQFVFNCSADICKKAKEKPFKYLCKYFNIEISEETLSGYEFMFNNYAAAEQGKALLLRQRDELMATVSDKVPSLIKTFGLERLKRELGFKPVKLSEAYFPIYRFQYVSPGGKSAMSSVIQLDADMLERFIDYLGNLIKFRKSIAGQRALMTQSLRNRIKERDDYTCQACGLSTYDEKNLLLEIDHIKPLAKGGITSEDNLQTLCWKCNRSKGSKLLS